MYKLLFISLILIGFLTQPVIAQKRELNNKTTTPSITLADFLAKTAKQFQVNIAYESTDLQQIKISNQHYQHLSVKEILNEVLKETGYSFIIQNQVYVIYKIPEFTVSGYIEDKESKERIVGAIVQNDFTQYSTITNHSGFFSIQIKEGKTHLKFFILGYKNLDTVITITSDNQITISLEKDYFKQEEIKVSLQLENDNYHQLRNSGHYALSFNDLKSNTTFLGEKDLFKYFHTFPGIEHSVEGTSNYLVRGGGKDQNLILVDGIPLYNGAHFLDFFSTINPGAVKSVDFYKSAMPARFGGRGSSVMDIVTKDGDLQKIHGSFDIGLVTSQLTLEGPIKKDKTSLMISGRRSYLDLLLLPFIKDEENTFNTLKLNLYDIHLKLQHKFTEGDKIVFSLYKGADKFGIDIPKHEDVLRANQKMDNTLWKWNNFIAGARWNHRISDKSYLNLQAFYTQYIYGSVYNSVSDTSNYQINSYLNSGIVNYGAKVNWELYPSNDHKIRAGGNYTIHYFTPGKANQEVLLNNQIIDKKKFNNRIFDAKELNLYFEDQLSITEETMLNVGIRSDIFKSDISTFFELQPRFSFSYKINKHWISNISYDKTAQFVHLLISNEYFSYPKDLWMPSSNKVKPLKTNIINWNNNIKLQENKLTLNIDIYYKKMTNLIKYQEGFNFNGIAEIDWTNKVITGKGTSIGAEIQMQYKSKQWNSNISYSLAKYQRQFPDIDNNQVYPFEFDRRHFLNIQFNIAFFKNLDFTANWMYHSAQPFTVDNKIAQRADLISGNNKPVLTYHSSHNNFRFESVHRLDISLNYHWSRRKSTVNNNVSFSILNVYNRKNPIFYYTQYIDPDYKLYKHHLFPFFPSLSYSLNF